MTFLVVAFNTPAKTAKLTTPTLQPSPPTKICEKFTSSATWGALTLPLELHQNFLSGVYPWLGLWHALVVKLPT